MSQFQRKKIRLDRSHQREKNVSHVKSKSQNFNLASEADENITSESETEDIEHATDMKDLEKDELSPYEQRQRFAKQYLQTLENEQDEDTSDIHDGTNDFVSERLKRKRLHSKGLLFQSVASNVHAAQSEVLKGFTGPITCVSLANDNKSIYCGSKDNSITSWNVEYGNRNMLKPKWTNDAGHNSHDAEIMAIAITDDDKVLASGGKDKLIRIFDVRVRDSKVHSLTGHRSSVNCLSFRKNSNYALFSGSSDRTLKHWDIRQMGYVETLFGHQDEVLSVDCSISGKPLSASVDRTIRSWRVEEETHLVFRGGKSSVDNACWLTDDVFLSAGQDGQLNCWKENSKTALASTRAAHGSLGSNANWISSLASLSMSDLCATGANDGFLRFWKINVEERTITPAAQLPIEGFINAIAIRGDCFVAGVGKEHRMGRWLNIRGNHNKIVFGKLSFVK